MSRGLAVSVDSAPDTIYALASGFGRAAIAVIRLSGPACAEVLAALGGTLPPARRQALRALRDPISGEVLDRAIVVHMPGPATFTGEDMAELHLHGGLAVRQALLRALAGFPGCRMAQPGEFARRAVLAGRLDLSEAEGIADLVDAETEGQRRQALRQLDGALGQRVAAWRACALDLLVSAEVALDFSDEGDVDDAALDAGLVERAASLRDEIARVLSDGRRGERLREGFVAVLAGSPNAGKSTLLNALAGREAAIVSEVPGTTRDAIEVRCDLGGLPVVLIDTAGLRATGDAIEAQGIARTRAHIAAADLVLLLVPADGEVLLPAIDGAGGPVLRLRTKADLGGIADHADLSISALTGQGLDALLDAIQVQAEQALGGEALVTRARHRDALERACAHLGRIVADGPAAAPELVAEDIRLAARALGEIGGQVGVEDVLDRLFAGFCIGK